MAINYYSTDQTWNSWTTTSSAYATTTTWNTWVGAGSCGDTGTAGGYGNAGNAWYYWQGVGTATTSGVTTTDTTWVTWVDGNPQYGQSTLQPVESARNHKKRMRKENRLRAITEKKEKVREVRARRLLKEVLTPEQDKQLEEKGFFELVSVNSGQRYRINKGRSRNINKLDAQGNVIGFVCFHPRENVHNYDTMAVQKLMLENDEEEVRKVANFS